MGYVRASLSAICCCLVFTAGAWAQSVISAHSGVIHYIEGDVTIDGTAIHPKFAEFPDVKSGQLLATEEGRAEVLLTPGVFLRLRENSSVRMISNALADTRLEVVSGSALVEVGELLEHNAISLEAAGARIALSKKGLYRVTADPARVQVYDGQAVIIAAGETRTAKKGHEIDIETAELADTKFDTKDTDSFYRWSARRAEYVAAANVISARVASNSDYRSGFTGSSSAWSWNPYFGMYTFLPRNGVYWSPFGSAFYSPGVITGIYVPQRGLGWRGSGMPTSGSRTPVSVAPASGGARMGSVGGIGSGGGAGRAGTGGFSGRAGAGGRGR
jgi:hypothetical protein